MRSKTICYPQQLGSKRVVKIRADSRAHKVGGGHDQVQRVRSGIVSLKKRLTETREINVWRVIGDRLNITQCQSHGLAMNHIIRNKRPV